MIQATRFQKIVAFLLYPVVFVLALLLIFEEWLWNEMLALMNHIAKLSFVKQLENFFRGLPTYQALAALALPWFLFLPVKFGAVYLMTNHKPLLGMFLLLAAKAIGTAIIARVFSLTKEQVLQIRWFKKIYELILFLLTWAKTWLQNSKAYQVIHVRITSIRLWFKLRKRSFLSRNFQIQVERRRQSFMKKSALPKDR